MRRRGEGERGREPVDHVRTRAVVAVCLSAAAAFAVVATGTVFVARRIALTNALAEATRTARTVGNVVFAPAMPHVLAGDAAALAQLDAAVRTRRIGGALVRVKVWSRDATVLYSDKHSLIGRTFADNAEVREVADSRRARASLSSLDGFDNSAETRAYRHLVEVYLPLTLDDGRPVVFEVYSTDQRLREAERELRSDLQPFGLMALLVLLILQLPVTVWLVNRMHREQVQRSRLLANLLLTSNRERRLIASELHDGVVQNLAGTGYAMSAALRTLPAGMTRQTREALEISLETIQDSVHELRNVIVDVRPSELSASGLVSALNVLAERAREDGLDVQVTAAVTRDPHPEVAATVYRAAKESITNVLKHARASSIDIRLVQHGSLLSLEVLDDGAAAPHGYDNAPTGHMGLALLRSAAHEVGGYLRVTARESGGTAFVLDVPMEPARSD